MDQQMPIPYDIPLYQPTQLTGPTGNTQYPQSSQPAYQQQQLQNFWANQYQEIRTTTDFRTHSLPLARIKKVMKFDEGVRMISAEAPVVFARACEMFVLELTLRSWNHTEENKRRTLHRNDIAAAIANTDLFDFLVGVVPRDDPGDGASYLYMPPQQSPQLYASPQQM